jgi:hypothetical protein
MTDVRTIEVAPVKDGQPLTEKRTVAVDRDALRRQYNPPTHTRPLTPMEAIERSKDRWPAPSPGADAAYSSGTVTVRTPREVMERQRKEAAEQNNAAATASQATKLRDDYHRHAAKVTAQAQAARGDAAKEARAAESVRETAALGAALKARGILS